MRFFAIYEDSNMVSKPESCGIVNQQMKSNIDFTEIPIKRRCFKSIYNYYKVLTEESHAMHMYPDSKTEIKQSKQQNIFKTKGTKKRKTKRSKLEKKRKRQS